MPAQKKKARPKLGAGGGMFPMLGVSPGVIYPNAPQDRLDAYQEMSPRLRGIADTNPRTFGLEPPAGPRLDPSGIPHNTGSLGIQSGALPTYPGKLRPLDPAHAAQPNLGPIPQLAPPALTPNEVGANAMQQAEQLNRLAGRSPSFRNPNPPSFQQTEEAKYGDIPGGSGLTDAGLRAMYMDRAIASRDSAMLGQPIRAATQWPGAWQGSQRSPGDQSQSLYLPSTFQMASEGRSVGPGGVMSGPNDDRAQRFAQHMQWINDRQTAGLQPMENRRDMITARATGRPVEHVRAARLGPQATAADIGAAYGPEIMMGSPDMLAAQQHSQYARNLAMALGNATDPLTVDAITKAYDERVARPGEPQLNPPGGGNQKYNPLNEAADGKTIADKLPPPEAFKPDAYYAENDNLNAYLNRISSDVDQLTTQQQSELRTFLLDKFGARALQNLIKSQPKDRGRKMFGGSSAKNDKIRQLLGLPELPMPVKYGYPHPLMGI